MGNLRKEYQKQINQNAQNQYWGSVMSGIGQKVDQNLQREASAKATEQALLATNPDLANKGLGEALARNPALADALIQPYVTRQNQMALADREHKYRMDLEGVDARNARELEEMRIRGNNQGRMAGARMELDLATRKGQIEDQRMRANAPWQLQQAGAEAEARARSTHNAEAAARGLSPEAWAARLEEERQLKLDKEKAILDAAKTEKANRDRDNREIPDDYYSPDVSPFWMKQLREKGGTMADLQKAEADARARKQQESLDKNRADKNEIDRMEAEARAVIASNKSTEAEKTRAVNLIKNVLPAMRLGVFGEGNQKSADALIQDAMNKAGGGSDPSQPPESSNDIPPIEDVGGHVKAVEARVASLRAAGKTKEADEYEFELISDATYQAIVAGDTALSARLRSQYPAAYADGAAKFQKSRMRK